MKKNTLILSMAVAAATVALSCHGATDAERIRVLEEQLEQQKAMMRQQQQMLETMQTELNRLKNSDTPVLTESEVAVTAQTPPPALKPTSPPEPAADQLSMRVYGFAMADAIYDFKRVDPNWEDTLRVSTIPTADGEFGEDGNFKFGVRQSRLGIKGGYGDDITYLLEAELFGVGGDEGQTTPRLRHAYATYKNFGMGQTWSNFMDIDIFPNTIDYWGPTGMVFWRNIQARYTFPMGEDELSIALEEPSTALTVGRFRDTTACELPNPPEDCDSVESGAGDLFQAYNDVPDLSLRYRNNGDFGHYQVAGIVRKLGYERLAGGGRDHEIGWGINTSAGLRTWGRDLLKLQVAFGEGVGNYLNDGGLDLAPSSSNLDRARAETVPLLAISAYYDHYWSEKWSTSFGWSMTDLDSRNGQLDSEFSKGQIAQINLLHYPADNVLMGTEFIWGEREDVDGSTGTDYRIQFSLKINFDSGDLISPR